MVSGRSKTTGWGEVMDMDRIEVQGDPEVTNLGSVLAVLFYGLYGIEIFSLSSSTLRHIFIKLITLGFLEVEKV